MKTVPCTFERTKDNYLDGSPMFLVTIYFLYDGSKTISFKNQSELFEHAALANELGISYQIFYKRILVHRNNFSDTYKEILDYVSESDND